MVLEVSYTRFGGVTISFEFSGVWEWKNMKRMVILFICLILFCIVVWQAIPDPDRNHQAMPVSRSAPHSRPFVDFSDTNIFLITPTYKRAERLADMTRLSQTLMHISDIFWIVVEDGTNKSLPVERLLKRSRIPYVYMNTVTIDGLPKRGWSQRNLALDYLRKNYAGYKKNAVVYFVDDDNSYDVRLFDGYVRNVKTVGVWAVGLSGAAKVEAPYVKNGIVKRWSVVYGPGREFAVDMAGFAVNLRLVLNSTASFGPQCKNHDPENCFLKQLNITKEDVQPFGWNSRPRDILAWHTKTSSVDTRGDDYGYIFGTKLPPSTSTTASPMKVQPDASPLTTKESPQ